MFLDTSIAVQLQENAKKSYLQREISIIWEIFLIKSSVLDFFQATFVRLFQKLRATYIEYFRATSKIPYSCSLLSNRNVSVS